MTRNDDAPSRILLPDAPADQAAILAEGGVACWSEPVWIDTYEPGDPDPYPLFLDRRVYQGSSGRVYPLPMIDAVSAEKKPRRWNAIHLENAYVRLMLLPEIGGRIHIGFDKVAGYDFFYRNNVIKPALVGLAGPWISGGVEFNWPQHHRPATFLPVDARIEREDDGAVVVWHSDIDPLQRMRGTHGIRVRPGSSLIEADVHLHNRTDGTQTFLWWANVAAASHERYQSFFPDDVAYVADHARRAISAFPRADRPYYGVDYPALAAQRADADRIDVYSNIPVPTSYMITDTDDAFFGGYDHAADAGFVHWADPAISPGKKQWTWGDGEIGRAWDAQLTDTDGPYVELMAGVFTDNQPDFAWLLPGETKRFRQYWYPIHRTGPVRQATTDAAISVDAKPGGTRIGVAVTRAYDGLTVSAAIGEDEVWQWSGTLSPATPLVQVVDARSACSADVDRVTLRHGDVVLVEWRARDSTHGEPWVATEPSAPTEIASTDELLVTATHLQQYRHPTRDALPYLREALRRDPGDTRAATALGAWHLRRGEYALALEALQTAVSRATARNLSPRDGEPLYLLGLVHERLGDDAAADRAFARAGWNAAWSVPSALARARIALRAGRSVDARYLAETAGAVPEARRLVALADPDAMGALALARHLHRDDPLDAASAALVRALAAPAPGTADEAPEADSLTPLDERTALDVGAEFERAARLDVALAATEAPASSTPAAGRAGPLRHYLRALWLDRAGEPAAASAERRAGAAADASLAFPAGLEQYDALRAAVRADSTDATAAGLLGMWLLDAGRHTDAVTALQTAADAGSTDPVMWRNLALARVAATGDDEGADAALRHALHLRADARLVLERDLLAERRGLDAGARLALLNEHAPLIGTRDDLALRHVSLLLDLDRIWEAWRVLTSREFRPFEGGEGRVIAAFDRAICAQARALLADGTPDALVEAAQLLTLSVPAHLGEGRHPAEPALERIVLLGDVRAAQGAADAARATWASAVAPTPLAVAERPADALTFWRGIAHLRLGDADAAEAAWRVLGERAQALHEAPDAVDYFATSLPELTVFDTGTAAARRRTADELDELATRGRALTRAAALETNRQEASA
ncbi:MAG: DUF5107 domain-containing protein [Microbacterium sp.]|uniref:DUF5107 domain-containing protein n=1 Tax=unclassified Microbacterium TaxID=2609290 RepID=UPI000C47E817|nr:MULTISPECIES: DUF5107 domain-containing protein [unclassified Microbacterium]MAY51167.1 DUF5107 domain-containing protein [Microbacterium sp.]